MHEDTVTIRFCEQERYDPLKDEQVVRLMCVTNVGTWHTEVPMAGPGSALRSRRSAFKNYVLNAIAQGFPPKEVTIG